MLSLRDLGLTLTFPCDVIVNREKRLFSERTSFRNREFSIPQQTRAEGDLSPHAGNLLCVLDLADLPKAWGTTTGSRPVKTWTGPRRPVRRLLRLEKLGTSLRFPTPADVPEPPCHISGTVVYFCRTWRSDLENSVLMLVGMGECWYDLG